MKLFPRIRPTLSLLLLTLSAVLFLQQSAFGQGTGTVTGIVLDTSGAVIPKATVELTNLETSVARSTTSNGDGAFAFAGVLPGNSYKLVVTASGFESWQLSPFAVRVGEPLAFTNIALKVGAASTAVTVEAAVDSQLAALDTGERTDIITAKDLNTLSLVGRDATELVKMLPGYAMSTGDQGLFNRPGFNTAVVGLSGPTGAYSANGAGPTGIAVVTDGVSLTDIATNSGSVQQINIEMVQSVTAQSSTFSAVQAKGPAVISASSRTGGASFHGEAYFTGRDTIFNSNDWYDNYLRQPRPTGRYLFPGGQIGGPLPLPFTSYNHNRDKLFFFAAYEYSNQNFEADQQALSAWVPTMAEREGDFSPASLDAELCGARPDGNANPNSTLPMCNSNNYLPSGTQVANYNSNPYANTSGVALVNWFPAPNADPFTNPFGYNYIQQIIQQQNVNVFKSTLQYEINSNNRLFLIYGLQREIDQDPEDLGGFPGGSIPYPGAVTTGDVSNVLSLHYSRNIGATITNEFAAAMSFVSLPGKMGDPEAVDRFDMNSYNGGKGNFDYLGMYKNPHGDYSVPALADGGENGYPNMLMPGGFYNNQIHTKKVDPILQDNISWQLKNHFLQFGVYWETGTYNGIADPGSYPQGAYTFNPGNGYFEFNGVGQSPPFKNAQFEGCENPNTAGTLRNSGANYLGSCFNPTAMMYEGYADSFTQTNFTPDVDMRYKTIAGFANDSIKFHRLTFILGARIEHLGPWADVHNNGLATFSDALYNTECSGYTRNCTGVNMPGITWYGLKTGVSNSVNSPQSVYFSPRIGVSWDVFGKTNTVFRGGWGVYRNQEQFNPYALAAATAQDYKTSQLVGSLSFDQIDSTTPLNPPDFDAFVLSPSDTTRPIYYEFNGGIDQTLPWHSHFSAAYVGNHSVHLGSYNGSTYNTASDINIICGIETGCPANKNPENPTDNLFDVALGDLPTSMTAISSPGGVVAGLDTPEMDFYRPYPFYESIYQLKHTFYSNYNSAQVQWNKITGIVTYGANYTFAKNLATASSWNNVIVDPVNLRNDYNPVPYDRTHTFNIHYLVDFGRRYKGGNRWLSETANQWQISGISQVFSGYPLASENGENFGFGYGSILAAQVPFQNQGGLSNETTCEDQYGITPDKNGHTYCVFDLDPVTWLGTGDVQLMPTISGNPVGGPNGHQYVNALALGLPLPGTNGAYRLPYIHSPYYMDHDVSVLKNLAMGEGRNLQLRMAAFNVFNHPLVSFNNQDTNNLTLAFQNATVGKPLTSNVLLYPDFGVANIKVGNRLVEFEGKFTF
jgi:hypothetical protein